MSYRTLFVARTTILLTVTLIIQAVLPYNLSVIFVNMMQFLAVILVGYLGAMMIGLITPWVALNQGFLPPSSAPVIPALILGNVVMIFLFDYFYKQKKPFFFRSGLGILSATIVKYMIIHVPIIVMISIPPEHMKQVIQIFHTFIGGGLTIIAIPLLDRLGIKEINSLELKGTLF